MSNSLTLAN